MFKRTVTLIEVHQGWLWAERQNRVGTECGSSGHLTFFKQIAALSHCLQVETHSQAENAL